MSLGLGALGCSVVTGSQDTDFDWACKSWSHCLIGGGSHHEVINRAGLAHTRQYALDWSCEKLELWHEFWLSPFTLSREHYPKIITSSEIQLGTLKTRLSRAQCLPHLFLNSCACLVVGMLSVRRRLFLMPSGIKWNTNSETFRRIKNALVALWRKAVPWVKWLLIILIHSHELNVVIDFIDYKWHAFFELSPAKNLTAHPHRQNEGTHSGSGGSKFPEWNG